VLDIDVEHQRDVGSYHRRQSRDFAALVGAHSINRGALRWFNVSSVIGSRCGCSDFPGSKEFPKSARANARQFLVPVLPAAPPIAIVE